MAKERIIEVLKQHPFLQHFGPAYVELLAGLAREVKFEKDEVIYREGPAAHEFPRTVSRLIEMRTHDYMAQPHATGAAALAEAIAATA